LSAIQIEVKANGVQKYCQGFDVSTGGIVLLPSTLGVLSGAPNTTLRVTVRGYDQHSPDVDDCGGLNVDDPGNASTPGPGPRVLRRATLTYVNQHTLFLPMQLSFSCYDNTGCTDTQTCKAGQCVDDTIDPNTLADYDPSLLDGTQVCFSPSTCFSPQTTIDATLVDASSCTYSVPQGAGTNFNVRIAYAQGSWAKDPGTGSLAYSVGAAFEDEILSQDPIEGYTLNANTPGQFTLATGLCNLVKAATPPSQAPSGTPQPVPVISDVQVAPGCAPKQLLLPFCSAEQNKNVTNNPPQVACGVSVPLTASPSAVYVLVDNSVAMDGAYGPKGYATAMTLSFADPVFKKTYIAFDFLHHLDSECAGTSGGYTIPGVADFALPPAVAGKVAPLVLVPSYPDSKGNLKPLDLGAALRLDTGAYKRVTDFVTSVSSVTKVQNPINDPSVMVFVNRIPTAPGGGGGGDAGAADGGGDAGTTEAGAPDPNVGLDCPPQAGLDEEHSIANQVKAAGQAGVHTYFVVLANDFNNGATTLTFYQNVASDVANASFVSVIDATSTDPSAVFSSFQSTFATAVSCVYDAPPGIDTTATLTVVVPPNTPGFPPSLVPIPVPIQPASGCTLANKSSSSVNGWNIDNGHVVICGQSCLEVQAGIGQATTSALQKSGALSDAGVDFDGGNLNVQDVPVSATMPCSQ
jgi:hypothetical protein